jgi:hypothetical protein
MGGDNFLAEIASNTRKGKQVFYGNGETIEIESNRTLHMKTAS